MTQFAYVALIQDVEPGGFLVTFPDVPEAITQGDSWQDAETNAGFALDVALEGYLIAGEPWPDAATEVAVQPKAGEATPRIAVDPGLAARAMLTQAMKAQGLSKVGLAARLHRDEKTVRRILSGKAASFDLTLEALRVVGIRPGLFA